MPTRADIQANKEQVFFDENEISLSGVSFELVTQNCKLIMVHGKRNYKSETHSTELLTRHEVFNICKWIMQDRRERGVEG